MADHWVHRLQISMPLAAAEKIADGALKAGGEAGLLPLTVAVLDVGGHLVLLKRQDGSGNLRADIAIGKAAGALGMGISSRTIRDRLKDRPAFQGAIAAASDGRFIPVPGGVLVLNDKGDVIGAVGHFRRRLRQGRIRRHHRRPSGRAEKPPGAARGELERGGALSGASSPPTDCNDPGCRAGYISIYQPFRRFLGTKSFGPRRSSIRWQRKRSPKKSTTTFPARTCSTPTARAGLQLNMFCMSLMKAENRKAFKADEAEVPRAVSADARAARGDPQAPVQPDAGTRRQHLFHRQARRDRRSSVPASRRGDDRLDAAGLRRHDAARRPLGRRQPQPSPASTKPKAGGEVSSRSRAKSKVRSKGKKRRG